MWVYNNGTNVVDAMNYAVNFTAINSTATNITATNVTATNVTAGGFLTANFSIIESGDSLVIKYGSTSIMKIDSGGNVTSIANITAFGSI